MPWPHSQTALNDTWWDSNHGDSQANWTDKKWAVRRSACLTSPVTIHSHVPLFPRLAHGCQKEAGDKRAAVPSIFMVIPSVIITDQLSPATQHPSLPLVWRTRELSCTMHLRLKNKYLIFNIPLLPTVIMNNHVYPNIHLRLTVLRLLVNHLTWDTE